MIVPTTLCKLKTNRTPRFITRYLLLLRILIIQYRYAVESIAFRDREAFRHLTRCQIVDINRGLLLLWVRSDIGFIPYDHRTL